MHALIQEFAVFFKAFSYAPYLFTILALLAFVGVLHFLDMMLGITSGKSSSASPASPAASRPAPVPFNKEEIRLRLEEFVVQERMKRDLLVEILALLGIRSPGVPSTRSEASPEQKPDVALSRPKSGPASAKPIVHEQPAPSGFFSPENIKTLLISGSCLFIFSAYLFVRSYWSVIPDVLKFFVLAAATVGFYLAGRILHGGRGTTRTGETLLTLAVFFVPFNVYAANVLLLNHAFTAYASWAAGAAGLFLASLITASIVPTAAMGWGLGLGVSGTLYFASLEMGLSGTDQAALLGLAPLLLAFAIAVLEMSASLRKGIVAVLNLTCAFVALGLLATAWRGNGLVTAMTFLLIGAAFAIEARVVAPSFAYPAGTCFVAAAIFLLRYFKVPAYQHGLFLIPGAVLGSYRAWTIDRAGQPDLARPYLYISQLVFLGSLLSVLPGTRDTLRVGFVSMSTVLALSTVSYAFIGVLFRKQAFTYAAGTCLLLTSGLTAIRFEFSFMTGLLLLAAAGCLLAGLGVVFRGTHDRPFGIPLSFLGLGSMSLALALIAGRWGATLLSQGAFSTGLRPEELKAGIGVASMGAVAYFAMALVRGQGALVFPALASATMVYVFSLEALGIPVSLLNLAGVVAVSMALMLLARAMKWDTLAQCFSIWAVVMFGILTMGALALPADEGLTVVFVCGLAFLPAIATGLPSHTVCLLTSLYLGHALWFRQTNGMAETQLFLYGCHLLVLNSLVIFLRTLLTYVRPATSVAPYRFFAFAFSTLSLVAALADRQNAWQLYLAYGVVALIVSHLHYQGRLHFVGASLLVAAYELLLWSLKVELTEAYTVPLAAHLLFAGYRLGDRHDARTLLYLLGQVILYLPSFVEAVRETWSWHGLFLGVASLALMLVGIHQRNKVLAGVSLGVLLLNGFVQSFQFLTAIPRWVYLALGGLTLVTLGGVFEFKRETLVERRKRMIDFFDRWD